MIWILGENLIHVLRKEKDTNKKKTNQKTNGMFVKDCSYKIFMLFCNLISDKIVLAHINMGCLKVQF